MWLRKRLRLYPEAEQEALFFRFAGAMRWAYNEAKALSDQYYEATGKTLSARHIRYLIRLERDNVPEKAWLSEIPYHIIEKGVENYTEARKKFFKGISGFPKFKTKDRTDPSFFQRTDRYRRVDRNHIKITGVKNPVRVKGKPPEKVRDPYIIFDGKYWYLSYVFEADTEDVLLTDEVIGVDVGIKRLATVSDGRAYENVNKTERARKQEKRVKREQRHLSRIFRTNGGDKTTSGYRSRNEK